MHETLSVKTGVNGLSSLGWKCPEGFNNSIVDELPDKGRLQINSSCIPYEDVEIVARHLIHWLLHGTLDMNEKPVTNGKKADYSEAERKRILDSFADDLLEIERIESEQAKARGMTVEAYKTSIKRGVS